MERSGENLLQNFHRQVGGGNQWNPSSRWSGLPRRWGVGAKSVEQTTDVKKREETAEGRAEISRAAGRKYGIVSRPNADVVPPEAVKLALERTHYLTITAL
ncbi:hypothetical protein Bbelb_054930 [Branchiostoma belcheri]|nr:hypothetical protein Bbelb_054930 [Branchiostoma belcheri]